MDHRKISEEAAAMKIAFENFFLKPSIRIFRRYPAFQSNSFLGNMFPLVLDFWLPLNYLKYQESILQSGEHDATRIPVQARIAAFKGP